MTLSSHNAYRCLVVSYLLWNKHETPEELVFSCRVSTVITVYTTIVALYAFLEEIISLITKIIGPPQLCFIR